MRFYNYDTGVLDTVDVFPETLDGWEPYIPVLRRTEIWLRMEFPDRNINHVVLDILVQENNKTIAPMDLIPSSLAIPSK